MNGNPDVPRKLRALWALHATGNLDEEALVKMLEHESEHLRWWAIQFLCEEKFVNPGALEKLTNLARKDPSPMVRLGLASAMQRLPRVQRWGIAEGLVLHGEDAKDQNLPLMIWYGIEPLVFADRSSAMDLMTHCKIPLVRQFIARRLASLTGG